MKFIKLSAFALAVMALGLGSCSKECDVQPNAETNLESAAKTINLNNAQATITFSANPVAEGGTLIITAAHGPNDAGAIYLQELTANGWTTLPTNPLSIVAVTTADNGRQFRAFFDKTNGMDFFSSSLTLTVGEPCNFALTPITTKVDLLDDVYTFSTTYTIQTCDRAVNGFKLQGGLTNGATYIAYNAANPAGTSTIGATHKITGKGANGNTVITWMVGNMGMNDSRTFTVVYSKPIKCGGGLQTITGAWSAKGTFADDNTYAELGYNNQQTYMPVSCN